MAHPAPKHEHHPEHDHPHEALGLTGVVLAAELGSAEALCLAEGQKLTPARRRVLELLMRAGAPVKAYDLISAFGEGEDGPAKPPTVYRALEFLERRGLAHRIESLSAYVACLRGAGIQGGGHAAAFLICDCCGKTQEVDTPLGDALRILADQSGYALQTVAIEAHGRCAACRT